MSSPNDPLSVDMIRWTFTIDPARRGDVENYLLEQGLEVLVRDEETLVASWDEPEGSVEEVIEGMWAVYGSPFEITHEEFHRANLLLYDADVDDETRAVA